MSLIIQGANVNGRKIHGFGPDGASGWCVETRGPSWRDTYLIVWRKFGTLEDAQAEATRLGTLDEAVEDQQ